MFNAETAVIPDTLSLLLSIDFEKVTECCNSKYIVNSETALNSLKKMRYSTGDIANYFFMIGMLAKEKFDEINVDLQNHTIDGIQLPETLIVELNIILDGVKKG